MKRSLCILDSSPVPEVSFEVFPFGPWLFLFYDSGHLKKKKIVYFAVTGLSCSIQDLYFSDQESNLGPQHCEWVVTVTGSPGKSPTYTTFIYLFILGEANYFTILMHSAARSQMSSAKKAEVRSHLTSSSWMYHYRDKEVFYAGKVSNHGTLSAFGQGLANFLFLLVPQGCKMSESKFSGTLLKRVIQSWGPWSCLHSVLSEI